MRKRRLLWLIPAGALLIVALLFSVSRDRLLIWAVEDDVAHALDPRLTGVAGMTDEDTHSGFHGDGMRRTVLQLDAAGAQNLPRQLTDNAQWDRFPANGEAADILYGSGSAAGLAADFLPKPNKGWWYCLDRQSGRTAAQSELRLLEQSSVNLTAAVFDAQTGRLYYLEYDT